MPVPSTGRDVHFYPRHGQEWAAKITAVHLDGSVSLVVFPPGGPPLSLEAVRFCNGDKRPGHCAWPHRIGTD